jgi:antitoxin MazE
MRARVVRIGNSRGVRIPKPLIEQAGLRDEVEIAVEGSSLIIRAAARPRTGWATAFRTMAERGDDGLLDAAGGSTTKWDEDEWEWK